MDSEDTCWYGGCKNPSDQKQQLRVTNPATGDQMVMYVCPNHLHYITEGTRQGKRFSVAKNASINFLEGGQFEINHSWILVEIENVRI